MEKYVFSAVNRSVLEKLKQPFAVYQFVDKRVVTLLLSDGFLELFGYDKREKALYDMDNDMYKDTHPDDVARIANAALEFAAGEGKYEVIYRTRKKNSSDYTVVHAMGQHVYTEEGVRLAQVWYTDEGTYVEGSPVDGIEVSKSFSNALHELSLIKASQYDYLTGLPSMTYFFELAEAGKETILKNGGQPVLMYMDFSGMKFFNTKHGFSEGDKLLKSFARTLIQKFSNENCCRIGADHFAVFAEEEGLEDKLTAIFRENSDLYESRSLPVHVGIYPWRIEDVPVSMACDRAKFACKELKGTYSSAFNHYNIEMRNDVDQRQYIKENIDRAIKERWIQVYYQPIVRAVNLRVCDEEALARWIDPEKGFMSPAAFIPALEESGQIYKLDLCILEQVLEKLGHQKDAGLFIVPQSINLSRADFDACDIVEEIRKRVDAAKIKREYITIEITESVIGSDFDFMKKQIERFRSLGFRVWMDDFGSGYSSLDVLQSIKFDLIKFDMSFMRKLDEGESGKIILTELMKMATALGVDTVCEGVETEKQKIFLQEIGCSKLQGFYFCRPITLEQILERYRKGIQIGFENPEESEYFSAIGCLNLYDLDAISNNGENSLKDVFDAIPIGVLEIKNGTSRFVRSNPSYRSFIKKYYGFDLNAVGTAFKKHGSPFMLNIEKSITEKDGRVYYNERMPDGSVVHSFTRRIGVNPVTGDIAVMVAVLSITKPDEKATYEDLARALASDYYNIYVVDMETNGFVEYTSSVGGDELAMERHGEDFFESAKRESMQRIYEGDRKPFLALFTKENIVKELGEQGVFTTTYRLMDTGTPVYVTMKATRLQPDGKRIIIGISIIDAHMKQKEHYEALQRERDALTRIFAISDGYIALYTVDLKTDHYIELSASKELDSLQTAKEGPDFFKQTLIDAKKHIYPDDFKEFYDSFSKEKVLDTIREKGSFTLNYRLMINGKPKRVSLKAGMINEGLGGKIVIGVRAWRKRG